MKNKMTLCVAILAAIFGQACSDSASETSDLMREGKFTGDPDTSVKQDGKFFCDFLWTPGPKEWKYNKATGDEPTDKNDKANEPWCLIPYNNSAKFSITVESDESVSDYVCRDLSAQYNLRNEEITDIVTSIDGEREYETHKNMWCVPIGDSVVVSVQNLGLNHRDERLYHVSLNKDGLYNIEGHINFKFVRPVELKVLLVVYLNGGSRLYSNILGKNPLDFHQDKN